MLVDPVDCDRVGTIADTLLHGLVLIECLSQLVEIGNLQVRPQPHLARGWLQLPEDQPQQRCLPRPVATDDADLVAPHDGRRKGVDDCAVGVAERDRLEVRDQCPAALGLLNLQADFAHAVAAITPHNPQLFEGLDAAFVADAASLDPLPNPDFLDGQSLVEQGVLLVLDCQGRLFADQKRVVIAGPIEQPPAIDLHDPRGQSPQELAIVGHEDQGPVPASQERLQPLNRVEIEMVRRFVEQQHVGPGDDRPCEQHAAFHPRREPLKRRLGVEFHHLNDLLGPLFLLPLGLLALGIEPLPHDLRHRSGEVQGNLLREPGHARAGMECQRPAVPLDLTTQQPHERRLARSIAAQEPDSLPRFDPAGDRIEQGLAAQVVTEFGDVQERHEGGSFQRSAVSGPPEGGSAGGDYDKPERGTETSRQRSAKRSCIRQNAGELSRRSRWPADFRSLRRLRKSCPMFGRWCRQPAFWRTQLPSCIGESAPKRIRSVSRSPSGGPLTADR